MHLKVTRLVNTLKIPQAGLFPAVAELCAGGDPGRAFFTSFTFVDVASPELYRFLQMGNEGDIYVLSTQNSSVSKTST